MGNRLHQLCSRQNDRRANEIGEGWEIDSINCVEDKITGELMR